MQPDAIEEEAPQRPSAERPAPYSATAVAPAPLPNPCDCTKPEMLMKIDPLGIATSRNPIVSSQNERFRSA